MQQAKKKGTKRAVTGFTVFLLFSLALAIFLSKKFTTIEVDGTSMVPTLKDHEKVLVSKAYWFIGAIRDKDIIVIKDPGGPGVIIKRVVRVAGEDLPAYWRPREASVLAPHYFIPENQVFVMGDNRPVSEDSRMFGPVDMSQVIGKVVMYR